MQETRPIENENRPAPQLEYRTMLETAPVLSDGDGAVTVVSRAAVEEVLRNPSVFSSAAFGGVSIGNVRPLIPMAVDPPDHAKYRKLLDPLFAPRRMDAAEPAITEQV